MSNVKTGISRTRHLIKSQKFKIDTLTTSNLVLNTNYVRETQANSEQRPYSSRISFPSPSKISSQLQQPSSNPLSSYVENVTSIHLERHQRRYRGTISSALPEGKCPFSILKLPREGTPYSSVKKTFLKIAMKYHPDVLDTQLQNQEMTPKERDKLQKEGMDIFLQCRAAFEAIVALPCGTAASRLEVEAQKEMFGEEMTDEEFDAWFMDETGHNTPFQVDLDPKTMREVAEMNETVGGGLDRDGGMWTLARMVSGQVKSGKDAAGLLKLDAGEVRPGEEASAKGTLRRRRPRHR